MYFYLYVLILLTKQGNNIIYQFHNKLCALYLFYFYHLGVLFICFKYFILTYA